MNIIDITPIWCRFDGINWTDYKDSCNDYDAFCRDAMNKVSHFNIDFAVTVEFESEYGEGEVSDVRIGGLYVDVMFHDFPSDFEITHTNENNHSKLGVAVMKGRQYLLDSDMDEYRLRVCDCMDELKADNMFKYAMQYIMDEVELQLGINDDFVFAEKISAAFANAIENGVMMFINDSNYYI